jgi:hypothetical protein
LTIAHPRSLTQPTKLPLSTSAPQSVQRSPFVTGLKSMMEARRHSKLYYSKKGFSRVVRVSGVNRNPMKVGACVGLVRTAGGRGRRVLSVGRRAWLLV